MQWLLLLLSGCSCGSCNWAALCRINCAVVDVVSYDLGWLFCFGGLQITGLHVAGGSDVVGLNLTAHGVVVEPLIVEGVGRRLLLLWLKAVDVENARGHQFIVLTLL